MAADFGAVSARVSPIVIAVAQSRPEQRGGRGAEGPQPQFSGKRQRDQRIGDKGGEREDEQRPAQIELAAGPQHVRAQSGAGEIESADLVSRSQGLHRDESLPRAIQPGRMFGACRPIKAGRNALRDKAGRAERAKPVEKAHRRESRRIGDHLGPFAARRRRLSSHGADPFQHLNEKSRDRQIRPIGVGVDVKQHDQPLPASFRGHERRAVGQAGPGLVRKSRIGLGEHLPLHRDVFRSRQAEEGARGVKLGERLWLFPGHGPAEHAAVPAQAHGQQTIVGVGETRPCETNERPAFFDEARHRVECLARREPDIGEPHDIGLFGEQRLHRIHNAGTRRADLGEGRKRFFEVVERREQRLRLIGGAASDQRHALHFRARVEKRDGAGGIFPFDAQMTNVVAKFDRQFDFRPNARRAAKIHCGSADRPTFRVERVDDRRRVVADAQHIDAQRGRIICRRGERARRMVFDVNLDSGCARTLSARARSLRRRPARRRR